MAKGLSEIINRLSGLNLIKEKLDRVSKRIEKLSDYVVDHEKRLIRMETIVDIAKSRSDKNLGQAPRSLMR